MRSDGYVLVGIQRKWFRYFAIGLLIFAVSLGLASASYAQATGNLTGTVTDPKGLAVSGATVSVHNTDTGVDMKPITTTDAGEYTMPLLPPDTYDITVTQPGFATVTHKGVVLNVSQTVRIDFQLPVATTQQTVTVTTEVPILETEKTEQSQEVNENMVTNLPVSSRRWEQLALLTPGANPDGVTGGVSFHGLSNAYNQNSVDGANNESFYDETTRGGYNEAYVYSPDSIREFSVQSSGYNAELGQSAGGSVNAVTKSGTSQFHGDLFFNGRAPAFNAYDPASKAAAASALSSGAQIGTSPAQTVHQQDQYGGSLGGPIVKDKLFFFVTYDGFRKVEENIVNPAQNNPVPSSLTCPTSIPAGTVEGGATWGTAAVPVTLATVDAQCHAAENYMFNHYYGAFQQNMRQDIELIKFDYQLNASNHLSAVTDIRDYHLPVPDNELNNKNGSVLQDRFIIGTLNSVIGSNKVNELRFQWSKDNSITSANTAASAPEVALSSLFTYGNGDSSDYTDELREEIGDNFSITRGTHTFKLGANVNFVSDNVQGSVTADGPYSYSNVALPTGVACTAPNTGSQSNNTTLCDWVLDLFEVNAAGTDKNAGQHYASFSQTHDNVANPPDNFVYNMPTENWAGYIQDTWKAKPNLTVNLGLRYDIELFPPLPYSPAEVFGPTHDLPIYDLYTTRFPPQYNGFEPRIGFAWNFRKSTVLRFSGGEFLANTAGHNLKNVYSGAGEVSSICNGSGGTCVVKGLVFPQLLWDQNKDVHAGTASFPGLSPALQPMLPSTDVVNPTVTLPAPGLSIRGADPTLQRPVAFQLDAAVEQQLPGNLNLSVGYIFTRGNHLPRGYDPNIASNFNPSLCTSPATTAGSTVGQGCGVNVTTPIQVYNLAGQYTGIAQNINLYSNPLTPLTGPIVANQSTINTMYNGLVVTLRRPFRNGVELLANYTLSHATDTGSAGATQLAAVALDPFNTKLEKEVSSNNVPNRFVSSIVYAPTFAQKFNNKVMKELFDGINISSSITLSNGGYYSALMSSSTSPTVTYCSVVTASANCSAATSGYYLAGQTAAAPATFQTFKGLVGGLEGASIGSTGASAASRVSWLPGDNFELPNLYDVDLRLTKTFAIKERYHFEIRGEAFNLFNWTEVMAVSTTAFSQTLGTGSKAVTTAPGAAICPQGVTCMIPSSSFGTPSAQSTTTLLGARQLQATVRFEF